MKKQKFATRMKLSYKAGKIFVVREEKGSVKISELDRNNRDVERDSSDESDIDESPDSETI